MCAIWRVLLGQVLDTTVTVMSTLIEIENPPCIHFPQCHMAAGNSISALCISLYQNTLTSKGLCISNTYSEYQMSFFVICYTNYTNVWPQCQLKMT